MVIHPFAYVSIMQYIGKSITTSSSIPAKRLRSFAHSRAHAITKSFEISINALTLCYRISKFSKGNISLINSTFSVYLTLICKDQVRFNFSNGFHCNLLNKDRFPLKSSETLQTFLDRFFKFSLSARSLNSFKSKFNIIFLSFVPTLRSKPNQLQHHQ